jgi:DNA polymerase-3 subunit delta
MRDFGMPVIVLAGDEEFEISRRVADLKTKLLDEAWASFNFTLLDNPALPEIIEAAASLPFGPGNRVVLVDRCELFTKKRSKGDTTSSSKEEDASPLDEKESPKKSKEKGAVTPEAFATALSSVFERTYLIFSCPHNFDSSLKISKAVAQVAEVESFAKEKYFPGSKSPKLQTWCRKEAKRYGATIDDGAIDYLLAGADGQLRQVSSEIGKAATCLLPATDITYDLVVKLSPHQSHVFEFADRWVNGSSAEALISLAELLDQQSAIPILAAMQTMLSKWIKMKILTDEFNNSASDARLDRKQLPIPELAKKVAYELKLMPFSVERDLKRLANHTSDELIEKQSELTRLEFLIKTGQLPDQHALELFALRA